MPQSVILISDVPGLGQLGDTFKVKDGFARNYLIPEGKAKRARRMFARTEDVQGWVCGQFMLLHAPAVSCTTCHAESRQDSRDGRRRRRTAEGASGL